MHPIEAAELSGQTWDIPSGEPERRRPLIAVERKRLKQVEQQFTDPARPRRNSRFVLELLPLVRRRRHLTLEERQLVVNFRQLVIEGEILLNRKVILELCNLALR